MAINDEELKAKEVEEPKAEETTEVEEEVSTSEQTEMVETNDTSEKVEEIVVEEKTSKTKKSKKSDNKKPSKVKATFSELKKVTWPSFGSVVKKTAVVLSVTLIFLVVIIGIDQLLYLLFNFLTSNM